MIHRPVHCVVPLEGDGSRHDRADAAFHAFHGYPGTWLPAPALPIDSGFRVRLRMPSRSRSPDVAAIVTVGSALHPRSGLSVRSLHWRAETAHDLFPVLDGDLELHTDDEPLLRLTGSYTPPMSVLGALTDQVVGRHLASEVVRGFTTDVAGRRGLHLLEQLAQSHEALARRLLERLEHDLIDRGRHRHHRRRRRGLR